MRLLVLLDAPDFASPSRRRRPPRQPCVANESPANEKKVDGMFIGLDQLHQHI